MTKFEYKVIAAPRKAAKVRGIKRGEDRFAASLAALMNELGAQGWEYQRTDTLPVESRAGMLGHTTRFHNMLVFRRVISAPGNEVNVLPEPEASPAELQNPPAIQPAQSPASNGAENPASPADPSDQHNPDQHSPDQDEISSARA